MRLAFILCSILLLSACKKDAPKEPIKNSYIIDTDQGSKFEVSNAGKTETISGSFVNLGSGQLLNQAFFRQFSISTNDGTLNLRFSFPSSMIGKVEDNLYKNHLLYEYPLSLEATNNLKELIAEAFFSSSKTFSTSNAKGKVDIKSNFSVNGTLFSVFGEVDFTVRGQDGQTYFVKGYFWKK